jgi:N-acetylglucosamine-6-sulfatase
VYGVRKTVLLLASTVLAGLLACGVTLVSLEGPEALAQTQKPNIIFVLTDDLDGGSIQYMPTVQQQLVEKGTTFNNGILTTPTCCPSRASLLRGQYTHNHEIFRESTGARAFKERGLDKSTVATWLHSSGYKTALVGKYLNGYSAYLKDTGDYRYIPPGWDRWYANADENVWARCLNENGNQRCYGGHPDDVLADKAEEFVRTNKDSSAPLFLWLAFNAPHEPAPYMSQDADKFGDVPLPRPPSFNEADVSDKPSWVKRRSLLTAREISDHRAFYRDRLRSLQTVDRAVGRLVEALADTGRLNNTYVVFWTDNGHHMGEHRLGSLGGTPGKGTPYVEDTRVPLIVRGPSVPADNRRRQELVLNTDIAPTFAELGRAQLPGFVDGRSFMSLFREETPPWRTAGLIGNVGSGSLNRPAFAGVISEDTAYVEYENDERELYNLKADPHQLQNIYKDTDPTLVAALEARLDALRSCEKEACRRAENGPNS